MKKGKAPEPILHGICDIKTNVKVVADASPFKQSPFKPRETDIGIITDRAGSLNTNERNDFRTEDGPENYYKDSSVALAAARKKKGKAFVEIVAGGSDQDSTTNNDFNDASYNSRGIANRRQSKSIRQEAPATMGSSPVQPSGEEVSKVKKPPIMMMTRVARNMD